MVTYDNFGVFDIFYFWVDVSFEDHAGDDSTILQGRAQNFAHANVVHVEPDRI